MDLFSRSKSLTQVVSPPGPALQTDVPEGGPVLLVEERQAGGGDCGGGPGHRAHHRAAGHRGHPGQRPGAVRGHAHHQALGLPPTPSSLKPRPLPPPLLPPAALRSGETSHNGFGTNSSWSSLLLQAAAHSAMPPPDWPTLWKWRHLVVTNLFSKVLKLESLQIFYTTLSLLCLFL